MLVLTAEQIHAVETGSLVDALREMHAGPVPLSTKSLLTHESDSFLALPAWLPDRAIGVKLASVMPGNESAGRGVPNIQAVYHLFDGRSGTPVAQLDGTALTYVKTAADSALATSILAGAEPRRLVMVGAGALSPYLIAAHRAVRPSIDQVAIWNRSANKARALAHSLQADAIGEDGLEDAVREADIISCATASTDPLVRGASLKPGTHVDLVGSFKPEMREADDEAVARAEVFVDSREMTVHATGDLAIPICNGVIDEADVLADLYQLCRGEHSGRSSDAAVTLFKNGGGGHLDLFVALAIVRAYGLDL